jgi:hypothetical protein
MIEFIWHVFTITANYNSSHIELLLNDIRLMNLYGEPLTNLELMSTISNSRILCLL